MRGRLFATLSLTLVACAEAHTAPPRHDASAEPITDGSLVDDAGSSRPTDSGSGGPIDSGSSGLTDGGISGPADGGLAPVFERVAGPGIWTDLIRAIAADDSGAVYVSDGQRVFRVVDGVPEVFLMPDELDPAGDPRIEDLTVDDAGNVAVLFRWGMVRFFSRDRSMIAEHDFTDFIFPGYIAARSPTDVVVVSREGLVHVEGSVGPAVLYEEEDMGGSTISCAAEAVAMARDRVYYLPGCNGTPIYAGMRDGSSMEQLIDRHALEPMLGFVMFDGIAAHPSDGLVVLMDEGGLFQVRDDRTVTRLLGFSGPRDFRFHAAPLAVGGADVFTLGYGEDAIYAFRGVL